jgi:conflict system STAND superfamily ATPase
LASSSNQYRLILPGEIINEWQLCDLVTGAKRQVFRVFRDQIVPETVVSFAASGLDRLKQGLTRAGRDPASFPWPPAADAERRPYPGLRALECGDAAVFFGRDAAIVRGLDTLRVMRERGAERIFVILGASGAGKSSFLRAGLLPRLKRDDRRFLPLLVIRPGRAVLSCATGLIVSLEQAFRELGSSKSRGEIRQMLQKPGGLNQVLDEIYALHCARLGPDNAETTLLLCVDQGEELFSTENRGEALEFLAALSQALARPADEGKLSPPRRRVISLIAIRTEAYQRLQTEPNLQGFGALLFSLPPMEHSEFGSSGFGVGDPEEPQHMAIDRSRVPGPAKRAPARAVGGGPGLC